MNTQSRLQASVGYAALIIVACGVLFAWIDPVSGPLLHASALLLGAICCVGKSLNASPGRTHWTIAIPLACAVWGTLQVSLDWTVYSFETWNSITAWLARASLFAAACLGFRDAARREAMMDGLVWFAGGFALLAILQWYAGSGTILWLAQTQYESEVAGTFLNRDQFAALMVLLLPIALQKVLQAKAGRLIGYAACAGAMYASVAASASRAGTLLVTAEAIVFLVLACRRTGRSYRVPALMALTLVACTLIGGWSVVWERFHAGDPFAFRREMLVSSMAMIRTRPMTGWGLGTWPTVYPAFAVFDPPGVYMNHAHNDWAEWASDGGVPLVALLAMLAASAAWVSRSRPWALGVPAVLLHACVDFPMQKPALACAVFFLLGVAMSAGEFRERHRTTFLNSDAAEEKQSV